ncbi:MAG: hypothetical protein BJ554DRAFT_7771, partial [Olpidium bornovanus]
MDISAWDIPGKVKVVRFALPSALAGRTSATLALGTHDAGAANRIELWSANVGGARPDGISRNVAAKKLAERQHAGDVIDMSVRGACGLGLVQRVRVRVEDSPRGEPGAAGAVTLPQLETSPALALTGVFCCVQDDGRTSFDWLARYAPHSFGANLPEASCNGVTFSLLNAPEVASCGEDGRLKIYRLDLGQVVEDVGERLVRRRAPGSLEMYRAASSCRQRADICICETDGIAENSGFPSSSRFLAASDTGISRLLRFASKPRINYAQSGCGWSAAILRLGEPDAGEQGGVRQRGRKGRGVGSEERGVRDVGSGRSQRGPEPRRSRMGRRVSPFKTRPRRQLRKRRQNLRAQLGAGGQGARPGALSRSEAVLASGGAAVAAGGELGRRPRAQRPARGWKRWPQVAADDPVAGKQEYRTCRKKNLGERPDVFSRGGAVRTAQGPQSATQNSPGPFETFL